jgi:hypothetical protein
VQSLVSEEEIDEVKEFIDLSIGVSRQRFIQTSFWKSSDEYEISVAVRDAYDNRDNKLLQPYVNNRIGKSLRIEVQDFITNGKIIVPISFTNKELASFITHLITFGHTQFKIDPNTLFSGLDFTPDQVEGYRNYVIEKLIEKGFLDSTGSFDVTRINRNSFANFSAYLTQLYINSQQTRFNIDDEILANLKNSFEKLLNSIYLSEKEFTDKLSGFKCCVTTFIYRKY